MVEHEPINPGTFESLRRIRTVSSGRSLRSRSSRPDLARIPTAQHLDDQSVYHSSHGEDHEDDESTEEESDLSEKVTEEDNNETASEQGTKVDGTVRAGVKDLESGGRVLKREKSTRSTKDPNLVGNARKIVTPHKLMQWHRSLGLDQTTRQIRRTGRERLSGLLLLSCPRLLLLHLCPLQW